MHVLEDGNDVLEVLEVELLCGLVLLERGVVIAGEFAQVLDLGRYDVIALDGLGDGGIVEAIAGLRGGIDAAVDDLAPLVLLAALLGKVEVAAIVAEAVVVCLDVLPCPVLRGELAVHGVLRGDVLAVVVMERPVVRPLAQGTAHLHRLKDVTLEEVDVLVGGDEDADGGLRLLGLDALGEVPEVALRHIGIREVLVRQARVACGELLGETMPRQEILFARKLPLGKQGLVGLVAHEAHELGRHKRAAHDVGKLTDGDVLVIGSHAIVPVVGDGEDEMTLERVRARLADIVSQLAGIGFRRPGAGVHLLGMRSEGRKVKRGIARDATADEVAIARDVVPRNLAVGEAREHEGLVAVLGALEALPRHRGKGPLGEPERVDAVVDVPVLAVLGARGENRLHETVAVELGRLRVGPALEGAGGLLCHAPALAGKAKVQDEIALQRKRLVEAGKRVWRKLVIGIEDRHVVALAKLHPRLAGKVRTSVDLLVQDPKAIILISIATGNGETVIRTCIDDDDGLPVLERLRLEAIKALWQVGSIVIGGNDDGESRHVFLPNRLSVPNEDITVFHSPR